MRYSEDLDYVRTTSGGIKPVMSALTDLGEELGFKTSSSIGMHPKVWWRTTSASGNPIKLKIEMNTQERQHALPRQKLRHSVNSTWWSGSADVLTFQTEELNCDQDPRHVSAEQGKAQPPSSSSTCSRSSEARLSSEAAARPRIAP